MMTAVRPLHVLVFLIFLICMKTSSLVSESLSKDRNMIGCIETEKGALLLFRQRGGVSDEIDYLDSWKKEEEDCCNWKGVGCDNLTGHVTSLHLSSLLSPDFKISNSLLDIPKLNYLDLSSNYLDFPQIIGSLTNLVHLEISHAKYINESVFDCMENLSNLQYLDLSFNGLGTIPKSIGSLSSLRYLDLSNSYLSDFNKLGNLSKLWYLILGSNGLTHDVHIPKFIGSLNSLRYLDLSNSGFSGVFPHELEKLSNLQYLNLSFNFLYGPIQKFIGSFNSLRYLNLSNCLFEGVIPHELGNLSQLKYLNLGLHNFGFEYSAPHLIFSGGISEWLFNLSSLTHLDLSGIKFNSSGIWASFIQRIPSISVLRLEKCNLSAQSSTFSNISSSISYLYLQQN